MISPQAARLLWPPFLPWDSPPSFPWIWGQTRASQPARLRSSFTSDALRAVKFVKQPLVQAKCLFPAVEFVPRLLRLFLVRAKIQLNITVRHGSSLRRDGRQVKIRRKAHSSLAKGRKCDCHRTNSCMQGLLAYHGMSIGTYMTLRDQHRRRSISASICLSWLCALCALAVPHGRRINPPAARPVNARFLGIITENSRRTCKSHGLRA